MKNYLSYGGGVNSTALLIHLLDQGTDFEAVYVDHGADLPETRRYVYWLSKITPITIIRPEYRKNKEDPATWDNLYEYSWSMSMVPSLQSRWCTSKFKVEPIARYVETPCFMLLGIDAGEAGRARIQNRDGMEYRYPLIEDDIDREGCKRIIEDHGLPVPPKSGCFFCPMQRYAQWRLLRRHHPDLFCKAKQLEDRNNAYRKTKGKAPLFLDSNGKSLDRIVQENQQELFKEYQPPCHCEL